MEVYKLINVTYNNNHCRQLSDNIPKYSVEMVLARLSLWFIKQSTVEVYYGVEANLHAFFTTAADGDMPLTSKPDRYFPS